MDPNHSIIKGQSYIYIKFCPNPSISSQVIEWKQNSNFKKEP